MPLVRAFIIAVGLYVSWWAGRWNFQQRLAALVVANAQG